MQAGATLLKARCLRRVANALASGDLTNARPPARSPAGPNLAPPPARISLSELSGVEC